jgi:hypothetical protein
MCDQARSDRWIAVALMLYSLGIVGVLLLTGVQIVPGDWSLLQIWPIQRLALLRNCVALTLDDGFYYFKIAQQIAYGAGSTFDGAHPTNGYHPLWLLCLTPIFWLTSAPDTALILGVIFQGVLLALGACLVYYIARLSFGRFAASLMAMLWVALVYKMALYGLEWGLHTLGMLAVIYIYLRWFGDAPSRPLDYLRLGLFLGLTFLARLDTLLLAATVGLFLAWRDLRGQRVPAGGRRLLAFVLPIVLAGLGYIGADLWLFGYPLPVSSAIKRDWSIYLLSHDQLYLEHGRLAAWVTQLLWPLRHLDSLYPLTLAIGTFGAVGCWIAGYGPRIAYRRQHTEPPIPAYRSALAAWQAWFDRTLRPWNPFVVFSLLQLFSYTSLYYGSLSFEPWYYVIQPLLAALFAAAVVDQCAQLIRQRGRAVAGALALILFLGWCGVTVYTVWSIKQWQESIQSPSHQDPLFDATEWARANLPAEAVIGAWNAGLLGYLSGRRVVDLDGLVNSWDYYRRERADLCRYWDQAGITYLVDVFENRRALSAVPTYPAYAACADRLELIWSNDRYAASWRVEAYRIGDIRPR